MFDSLIAYLHSFDLNQLYSEAKEWQTLIAGVLAIIGAWATLRGAQKQINSTATAESKKRSDESFAARAVVPSALSDICAYADQCIRLLARSIRTHNPGNEYLDLANLPDAPANVGAIVKDAIRFADDPHRTQLAFLLGDLQVHAARVADARSRATNIHIPALTREQLMHTSASLKASAVDLFEWARAGDEGVSRRPTKEQVRSELFLSGVHKGQFPHVDELVGDAQPDA